MTKLCQVILDSSPAGIGKRRRRGEKSLKIKKGEKVRGLGQDGKTISEEKVTVRFFENLRPEEKNFPWPSRFHAPGNERGREKKNHLFKCKLDRGGGIT